MSYASWMLEDLSNDSQGVLKETVGNGDPHYRQVTKVKLLMGFPQTAKFLHSKENDP